uniref:Riboflavin synthase n=1 Tax=Blastobotrys adeninivorans TaxID=409370 RepID=A0A060T347_BLAAD
MIGRWMLTVEVLEYKELDASESGGNGVSITVGNAGPILDDCHLGDSIAVNGVCLTVTEFDKSTFKVGVAPETLRRTTLGSLKKGDAVNLERAVAGHVRFGGHFVQGHVDCKVEIVSVVPDGNALTFTFKPEDQSVLKYIVEKGFIALDGTSLTITAVDDDKGTFSVMLIAFTQEKVILAKKKAGEFANVEVDLMGKLVEKQVSVVIEKQTGSALEAMVEKIVERKLKA